VAVDERLRRELEQAGRPADPSGVYEDLIRRRERRRLARRIKAGALAVAVAVGCIAGIVVLSRVFARAPVEPAAGAGQGIVFGDGTGEETDLFVVQADGSGLRRLTHDGGSGAASWSPDGSKIVFARYEQTQTSDLFVMNPLGSEVTRLTETPGISEAEARWSPDGSKIAFEASGIGQDGVYVMDANGSNVVRLTAPEMDSSSPDWSPDGSQLVFDVTPTPTATEGPGGIIEIWIMDADGGDPHPIVGDGASGNYEPRWSPGGDLIVFTRDRDVYIVRPDGTGLKNLTPQAGADVYDRDAAWSSDGERIVFASGRTHDDALSLFTMNPDGTDVQPVLDSAIGFCCPRPDWHGDAVGVPSPEPSPTEEPSPAVEGEDLGLGFPVCNVTSIEDEFAEPSVNSTAFVATRMGDTGGCPQADDAFNVIALDMVGDRKAETSFGPIECTIECRAFSSPDLDGDGTAELLVVQSGGSVLGMRLYDFESVDGDVAIVPVDVAPPGDPDALLEPGEQASFLLGGDAFELYTLQCLSLDEGVVGLAFTLAESLPHDAPDAEWHAHEVIVELKDDGLLHVVNARDFTEPVTDDPGGPSFRSDKTLCGANLGP